MLFLNTALSTRTACRYTFAFGRGSFIGFLSIASVIGIAFGVMVLITVLSVMNGFQTEVRTRLLSLTPHLTLYGSTPTWGPYREVQTWMESYATVANVVPFLEMQGMVKRGSQINGVMVRGIDPQINDTVFPLSQYMKVGALSDLNTRTFGVILGKTLALQLGVQVGDKITLLLPEVTVNLAGIMPRLKQLTVVGLFEVGYLYDNNFIFMNLRDVQALLGVPGQVTGLTARLFDPLAAPSVVYQMYPGLPEGHALSDWTSQNRNYFEAVRMEKTMMFFILLLIIGIAAFNLVSTLVMVVTEKRADIGIMRTLGAKAGTVMAIFIKQGMLLGGMGTALGVVLGVTLSSHVTAIVHWVERMLNRQLLSSEVYYINFLPSELAWKDVGSVVLSALLLSFFATLYPASRAVKVHPAWALRHG